MSAPAAGYSHSRKAVLFLIVGDEVWREDRWVKIKRLTLKRKTVVIRFSDGVKVEVPHAQECHARRPAQWIAPDHTGKSWGMPPGAGRP